MSRMDKRYGRCIENTGFYDIKTDMDIVFSIIGLIAIVGIALAIWEWRNKKTVLGHDLNLQAKSQSALDRNHTQQVDSERFRDTTIGSSPD